MKPKLRFRIVETDKDIYLECNGDWDIGYRKEDFKINKLTRKDVIILLKGKVHSMGKALGCKFKIEYIYRLSLNNLKEQSQKGLIDFLNATETRLKMDDVSELTGLEFEMDTRFIVRSDTNE